MQTVAQVITVLRNVVLGCGDSYYTVEIASYSQSVDADPFVACSFIEPNNETLAFPMEWTSGSWAHSTQAPDPLAKFAEWLEYTLPTFIADTRGDGCLYQAGWVAMLCDGRQLHTVNVTYSER